MVIIPIEGVIGWDVTEASVRDALAKAAGAPVEFHFSTPGGLIGAGLGIGGQIRNYPGETTAVLTGYAMSMGSYLPQCCDKRVAFDDAVFMIHNARGMTWGDHNDVLKYGTYLKGLSGVIAKKLAKCSNNDLEQVTNWMDEEKYFFGDDIVTNGFADEIRKSQKEIDKETAIMTARASYGEAVAKMVSNESMVKDDLNRAIAMNFADVEAVKSPAVAGIKKKEVQQMTLNELLSTDPAAKAEFDRAVLSAKSEGEKLGASNVQALIEQVSPYLTSTAYPELIRATALKVLSGKETASTLISAVAAVDAVREDQATAAAIAATKAAGEAAGQQQTQVDPTKPVASEEDLQAAINSAKGGE